MSGTAGAGAGRIVEPGGTIGILGDGQLGRMIALAAARLGYRSVSFGPGEDSPAAQVSAESVVADYEDTGALGDFAERVDVVTVEFENVPASTADFLADRVPVRPSPSVLRIAQDRLREKDFLRAHDVPTVEYREVTGPEGLARAVRDLGTPSVLKTARLGYDGKGQTVIAADTDPAAAWRDLAAPVGVLEAFVDFALEISVIVARGLDGGTAAYVPVENRHVRHILDTTIVPARIDERIAMQAEALARHIAEALDLVGIVAVEMFVTEDERLLVNEIAPRPHNSGHWTIDAAFTSQFEQTVRAVCGLPLGSPERHHDAVMRNLIGEAVGEWRRILSEPAAKLHLYGKKEVRPGRKMGHVTRLIARD